MKHIILLAPSMAASWWMAGRWSTVSRVTVVATPVSRPALTQALIPVTVRSKAPGIPLKRSWWAASAPSREISM
ncbi:MAG: hypothetical protein QHG97_06705 [Methanolinea sp.]|nr:hypothetical protein [Methanolinea sp.]